MKPPMTAVFLIALVVVLLGYLSFRGCVPLLKIRPNSSADSVGVTPVAKGHPSIPAAYLGYYRRDEIVADWKHPLTSVDVLNRAGQPEVWQNNANQVGRVKEGEFYLFIYPASRCSALMGSRLLEAGNWDPNASSQPRANYLRDVDTSKGPAACFQVMVSPGQYVFIDEQTSGLSKCYGWLIQYDAP